jgi:hypothetical protein
VFVTPISPTMPAVLMQAHAVSSLLSEHFFVAPTWGFWVEKLVFLLIAAYLIALLPRIKAGMAAGITAGLLVTLIAVHFALMTTQLMWLQLMVPAALLVVGHLLLTTKRFLVSERGKEKSDADSAESNRMLGLAFQGQGELDMALEYFRKLPRWTRACWKRCTSWPEISSASASSTRPARPTSTSPPRTRTSATFRNKVNRAKQLNDTVIIGGSAAAASAASTIDARWQHLEKPMLGRYEVEKELGKGAMGVVYLGKDPKINRVVAIKTMALSQEFEANELTEVKERFFREAETAGRLNQPNIVTHVRRRRGARSGLHRHGVPQGHDLARYTKPDTLLPLPARSWASSPRPPMALDYAHEAQRRASRHQAGQHHVRARLRAGQGDRLRHRAHHRFEQDQDRHGAGHAFVHVTRAAVGQEGRRPLGPVLAGGDVLPDDHCGKLPFEGDSMAQLMFRIANEPHPDIRGVNSSAHLPD